MSSVDGVLSELAGKDVCGDCFKTEVESDTEEMEEIIEHEGKKYRRRIKKRIVRTRQIQREIVTGPTPPMITSGSPPSSLGCDVFPSIEDSGKKQENALLFLKNALAEKKALDKCWITLTLIGKNKMQAGK